MASTQEAAAARRLEKALRLNEALAVGRELEDNKSVAGCRRGLREQLS